MNQIDHPETDVLGSLAEIIVNVLLRRLSEERTENGEQETCSSPERMD